MGQNSKSKNANKKAKTAVNFDVDERAKYLLGFRKRKTERKAKAKLELEEKIKQEKKRQRDLKLQSCIDKKEEITMPLTSNKMVKREVIETLNSTIVVSDLNNMMGTNKFSESESEIEDIEVSEKKDAEMTKMRAKMLKESSIIKSRLEKLEKRQKLLASPTTKSKLKRMKKSSKSSVKNAKSTRKFNQKETKGKAKKQRNSK